MTIGLFILFIVNLCIFVSAAGKRHCKTDKLYVASEIALMLASAGVGKCFISENIAQEQAVLASVASPINILITYSDCPKHQIYNF